MPVGVLHVPELRTEYVRTVLASLNFALTQLQVNLDVVNTSFTQSLTSRLSKRIDVILFNPPYVPTVHEEAADAQTTRGIQGSWAGGDDGMNVTNKFLNCVDVNSNCHFVT